MRRCLHSERPRAFLYISCSIQQPLSPEWHCTTTGATLSMHIADNYTSAQGPLPLRILERLQRLNVQIENSYCGKFSLWKCNAKLTAYTKMRKYDIRNRTICHSKEWVDIVVPVFYEFFLNFQMEIFIFSISLLITMESFADGMSWYSSLISPIKGWTLRFILETDVPNLLSPSPFQTLFHTKVELP